MSILSCDLSLSALFNYLFINCFVWFYCIFDPFWSIFRLSTVFFISLLFFFVLFSQTISQRFSHCFCQVILKKLDEIPFCPLGQRDKNLSKSRLTYDQYFDRGADVTGEFFQTFNLIVILEGVQLERAAEITLVERLKISYSNKTSILPSPRMSSFQSGKLWKICISLTQNQTKL